MGCTEARSKESDVDPERVGVETASRTEAVRASRLLESGPEEASDRIAGLAATLLSAPMPT